MSLWLNKRQAKREQKSAGKTRTRQSRYRPQTKGMLHSCWASRSTHCYRFYAAYNSSAERHRSKVPLRR
jgi:hypothetical protein